jgi:signal transduction histidine kinase
MRLHPRACAIGELVGDVVAVVDHKARDQGIAIATEVEPDLPTLVADPELLKTCFLNLLINAVDAMPKGGVVAVSIARDGDALVTTVTDTGQGMTAEEIRSAFEPYFSTKETGVGLGLALTRKIVEDHGGTVDLESVPERGTTARIRLPLGGQTSETEAEGVAVVRG